jgi:hypothetical protein
VGLELKSKKEKDNSGFHVNPKLAIVTVLLLLTVVSLEIYAHLYVSVHQLPVLTEDEAFNFVSSPYNGSRTFSGSGVRWLAVWRISQVTPSANFAYVYLFKIEQKGSFLVQSTDVAILGVEPLSNTTGGNFHANINEVIAKVSCIIIKIVYEFGKVGIYHVDFGLRVKVYDKTLLGYLPKEEINVPIEATIYYGP